MQKKIKHASFIALAVVIATVFLVSCTVGGEDRGSISLSLTDAPIADAANVEGVFITISAIEYHLNGVWIEDTAFEGPQTFNLLELTGGTVEPLSSTTITAGEVSQIRFMLDAVEADSTDTENPGSYIVFDPDSDADGIDETDVIYPLFVPSGAQTGYKAVGSFTVPSNGEVEITADFDVRKSVVKRGINDEYILKPTIRLVVNHQAGTIAGSFIEPTTTDAAYTVFAYADDTYDDSEFTNVDDDEEFVPFANAISSAPIDTENGSYTIPFLAEGRYDLVFVGVDEDGVYTVLDTSNYADIDVEPENTTTVDVQL